MSDRITENEEKKLYHLPNRKVKAGAGKLQI